MGNFDRWVFFTQVDNRLVSFLLTFWKWLYLNDAGFDLPVPFLLIFEISLYPYCAG